MTLQTRERHRKALEIITRQGYSDQEAARAFGVSITLIRRIKHRQGERRKG